MESQFLAKLDYVGDKLLRDLWDNREEIEFSPLDLFAIIANEFAHGNISARPWAAVLDKDIVFETIKSSLFNISCFLGRIEATGSNDRPVLRAYCYLLLWATQKLPPSELKTLLEILVFRGKTGMSNDVKDFLVGSIFDQLQLELQDVCADDCDRMSLSNRLTLSKDKDEIEDYWLKFDPDTEPPDKRNSILEKRDGICKVGYDVNRDVRCPLFSFEPNARNMEEFFDIITRVSTFRRNQDMVKRETM